MHAYSTLHSAPLHAHTRSDIGIMQARLSRDLHATGATRPRLVPVPRPKWLERVVLITQFCCIHIFTYTTARHLRSTASAGAHVRNLLGISIRPGGENAATRPVPGILGEEIRREAKENAR